MSSGYGPYFVLYNETRTNGHPSITFEDAGNQETLYLRQWHIHTPAEHIVDGHRSMAEMHLVHYTAESSTVEAKPRAVISLLIEPGDEESPFFKPLGFPLVGVKEYQEKETRREVQNMNPGILPNINDGFNRYFTYNGNS